MTENINQWQMIDGELINIDEYIFNSDAKDIDFNKILNIKELQLYQDVLFKAQKINAEVFDKMVNIEPFCDYLDLLQTYFDTEVNNNE